MKVKSPLHRRVKTKTTGDLVTKEYKVEGPVMLLMTTTAIDIDEELMNRCLVLSVNESREQTQAIHAAQRKKRTLAGLMAKHHKADILQQHRHAQQLIKPLAVVNPYADQLTFLDDKTRTRRDHEKYLTLIDSITLLHQHQREIKQLKVNGQTIEYVEVILQDIEQANKLAHDVLGRTLDELPPQTRKLLSLIQSWVQITCAENHIKQADFRFSRKSIREMCGWGNTQLKIHVKRLEDMEYLLVHRGSRGQSFEYELLYANEHDGASHLMGLIDLKNVRKTQIKKDKNDYDKKKSGVNGSKSAPGRGQVGGVSGGSRPLENPMQPSVNGHSGESPLENLEKGYLHKKPNGAQKPIVVEA